MAAGTSSRMGRPKLTLSLNGVPLLQKVLDTLHRTEVNEIVVVLGAQAPEVRRRTEFSDEKVVVNRAFAEGMSGSIRVGLRAVEEEAEAVLIVLGDQPLVTAATVDKLIESYRRTKALVVLPVYSGRRGNPVLFDRELFLEIEQVKGDVGAKSVVNKHAGRVVEVPVDDRGVVVDVDTPEDYSKIAGRR